MPMKEKIMRVIMSCNTKEQLESARNYLLLATRVHVPEINECWHRYIQHRRAVVLNKLKPIVTH